MADKIQLKSKQGTLQYPVTLKECILDNGVEIVPITTIEDNFIRVEPKEKYYRIDEVVNTLQIKIQYDEIDETHVHSLEVFFTTGDNPQIDIGASYHEIAYFSGFSIEPNTTYELNIMFNGLKWIVAYAVVE